MRTAYRIRIHGEVQGVVFRGHTKQQADLLGIKGWVRNEPDGSVLVQAEGQQDQLNQLVAWCQGGSPEARVSNVEVTETEPEHHTQFRVEE